MASIWGKRPFQLWLEIWIQVVVILIQLYKNHTWHQTSILVSWAFCGLGVDFCFFRNFHILNFTILVGKISHICTIAVSPIKFWMPGCIGRYRVTCWGPQTFWSSPRNGQLVTWEINSIFPWTSELAWIWHFLRKLDYFWALLYWQHWLQKTSILHLVEDAAKNWGSVL